MCITLMAVYKLNTNKIEICFQNGWQKVRNDQYAAAVVDKITQNCL